MDLKRFFLGLVMERPRASFGSSVLGEATLSFVLVRERDKDDRPPIIELKDILPNDPDDVRWVISGDLRGGEVGRGASTSAEFVRSRSFSTICEVSGISGCEGEISKFAVERRRRGNDMLETEASELRDSNVPVRLGVVGVDEPLAGALLCMESRVVVVDDGKK
jgi:hypothetical protein